VGAFARYYAVVRLTFSFGCLASIFIINYSCISAYDLSRQSEKPIDKKTLSLTGQGNQTLKLKNNPNKSIPFARYTYLVRVGYATLLRVVASTSYAPNARIGLQKISCIKYFKLLKIQVDLHDQVEHALCRPNLGCRKLYEKECNSVARVYAFEITD
jgi:hypothetical protein